LTTGRNNEEEYLLDENFDKKLDVRGYDKPLYMDNAYKDDDEGKVDNEPYTESGNEPIEHHNKSEYMLPIGDTASEDHAEVGDVHRSDTEAENNSTKSGKPNKKHITEVDNEKAHDGDYASTMLHMKPTSSFSNMSQDHYTSHSDSAYSYLDMEATCPPTTRNIDHVYANMTRVNNSALLDEDVPMEEKLVAQLDMIKQQATMDKKQIREELFEMKTRIELLEGRTLEQQVEPK
jgi:hypothetical protein